MTACDRASIPCNLCGGTHVTVLSRRSRSGQPLRSVACEGCGLVWSDPRPHEARQFYENDYRLAYKQTFEPRPKHVLRAGEVALSRLAKIRPWLDGRLRILDVGSGGGEFAYLLKTLGHAVQGVEPNKGYAGYAEAQYGLAITRGFIGDVPLPEGGFDLITSWHVLEHTEDPGAVLRQLRNALRPGGTLVVEVPNVEATCQSPRSSFHEAHLYTFNTATLQHLAAKSGLRAQHCQLSDDGGNLTAVFTAMPQPVPLASLQLPGNHARVSTIVRGHTPLSHALSAHPWRRAAGRFARAVQEQFTLRRERATGRALLDALYRRALQPQATAPTVRRRWPWVVVAYALALSMEELLLDTWLPARSWSEPQALVLYLGLQLALVAGLVWALRAEPRTLRGFLKLGGLATPMLALPAFC
jgi:2-polyprenyl-3-methyl-5-hydroxy-6-metoxy-1,4-benzoquinol methylase